MGSLVDVALFVNAETCGMEVVSSDGMETKLTTSCCSEEQITMQGQNEIQLSVDKISFEQQVFLTSFVYTYINLFEGTDQKISTFEKYSPPLSIRRIYKLDETYLI